MYKLLLISVFLLLGAEASAQIVHTEKARISQISSHYNSDLVIVNLENVSPADYNPGNCTTPAYFTQGGLSDKAHQAQLSMLLSAYMAGVGVQLVIADCAISNSPRIISVVIAR